MNLTETRFSEARRLYGETRGAFFVLTATNDGEQWKLTIPSVQETYIGDINFVLQKYILYVENNRELAGKNLRSKKYKLF
jgi:hypothetical protein